MTWNPYLASHSRNANVAGNDSQLRCSKQQSCEIQRNLVMTEATIEKPANAAAHKAVTEASISLVLLDKDKIKADQDGIRKSLIMIDQQIHDNAVQCMLHAEKHGDTSLMRRLLMEIVGKDTGYRRQGIIGWMRLYSPMELVGDVIKLTGVNSATGEKRAWRVEEAAKTPFWTNRQLDEKPLKPFFRETLISPLEKARASWKSAKENTVMKDGKAHPIDQAKPFFDGIHMDALDKFFSALDDNLTELNKTQDATKDVRSAQANLKKAELEAAALAKAG